MLDLFEPRNAEMLVSISRLSLQLVDRMVGALPPGEPLPAGELSALARLLSSALNYGLGVSNGPPL